MARGPRLSAVGIAQHIIQRGNNRQVCFACEEDFAAYAHWLKEGARKYDVLVHAWVFMTNHVHLLVTPMAEGASSALMQYIGRHYVRRFNYRYKRTGTLWEGRFKSSLVEDDGYFLACQRYIELNPVRAKMVDVPADYSWSSYRSNGLGIESSLISYHETYLALGRTRDERLKAYRSLFEFQLGESLVSEINYTLNKGLVLGSEKFKDQIEALTGQPVRLKRTGPVKHF